jgi:phosphoribosylformimino-5-aminoimidazole carboxamide ribonucleotide (ProFAR) isomerase
MSAQAKLVVQDDPAGLDKLLLAAGKGITRYLEGVCQTRLGHPVSLWDLIAQFQADGLRHVLCTDIERDGALGGPNLALYREGLERCPGIAWQASGGVRDAADLAALARVGVAAAISGKALLEGRMTTEELQPFLRDA